MSLLDAALRVSAAGPRSPEDTWARYTEPRQWPTWAPHIREVDYPHAVIEPGTSGRVKGVGGVIAVFTIETVDHDARAWSWRVRSGPLRLSFEHGVDAPGGGSSAWVVVHAPLPVAAGYAPVMRWSLGRLVAA